MLVYAGSALASYGFGQGHPFGPDRYHAFWRGFQAESLTRETTICSPVKAESKDLLLFHTPEYIDRVVRLSATGQGMLDPDTPVFEGVYDAACTVVGSVLDALGRIMSGESRHAFVPIAGLHHARRDGSAGFCVFNDCGIAIEALLQKYGVRRLAYVDIDAHHGDGVFYAFEDDPRVIIADIHEDGRFLYPGTGFASETGRGRALGSKLNLPLPPGADDRMFFDVWPRVEALLEAQAPEFILFQCGADSIAGDPITHMAFSRRAHGEAARRLSALATRCNAAGVLALGGGGYNRDNLSAAWVQVVREMLDAERQS